MTKIQVFLALSFCVFAVSALYKPTKQGGIAYGKYSGEVAQGGIAYGGSTQDKPKIPGTYEKGTGHHGQYPDGPDGYGVHVRPNIGQPSGIAYGTWGKGTWKH